MNAVNDNRTVRKFDDIILSSRYDIDIEMDAMQIMAEAVHPEIRYEIACIFCDSNAGSCYTIWVKTDNVSIARYIGSVMHDAIIELEGGHNGISVKECGDLFTEIFVVDPMWLGMM
ncbi:MAG: hypothetical protein WC683_18385 [bacterium]